MLYFKHTTMTSEELTLTLCDSSIPMGKTFKVFIVEQPEPGSLEDDHGDEGMTPSEIDRVMRDLAKLGLDDQTENL